MKVKNTSERGWTIYGTMIAPGEIIELADEYLPDISGISDLEVIVDDAKAGGLNAPKKA